MRKVWTVLSVLAVANLLALGGLVGWLAKSDRLDMGRVRALRAVLSKPLTQERSEAEAAAKAQEVEKTKAEQEKQASKPPLTAAERLSARVEATELDRQRVERLKREVADLQRQLSQDRVALVKERAALEAEKAAFNSQIAASATQSEDAQFQKTLGVLQTQKPKDAVTLLKQMLLGDAPGPEFAPVEGGAGAQGLAVAAGAVGEAKGAQVAAAAAQRTTLVVSYLDAMSEKKRSQIVAELTKTDPRLAADLLDRLRTRGEVARVP